MPHHDWSDKSFDWKSLNKAEILGNKIMKRLARIGIHSKEKYGTIRWSLYLFNGTLHSLTHPGYVYSQYPKWLWSFDVRNKPLKFLQKPINLYQKLIVALTFEYLVYKYPHITDEIISDAPRELLFKKLSKRVGKMWSTYCQICRTRYTCDNDYCPTCGKFIVDK